MVVVVLAVALSPSGLLPSDRFRPTARSPPSPSAPSPAALSGPALPPPPALPGALPGALRGGVSSSNVPLHPLFPVPLFPVPLHPLFPFFSSLLFATPPPPSAAAAASSTAAWAAVWLFLGSDHFLRLYPRKRSKMIGIFFSSLVFSTYPNRHNSIIRMYF